MKVKIYVSICWGFENVQTADKQTAILIIKKKKYFFQLYRNHAAWTPLQVYL